MKKIVMILGFVLGLLSCKKESEAPLVYNDCTKSEEVYNGANGAKLTLNSQYWKVQKNTIGGVDVGVKIEGSIVGDSATIRSFGDGLIFDAKISLSATNTFNTHCGVFFTTYPIPLDELNAITLIRVFKGQDTLSVNIESCPLPNVY